MFHLYEGITIARKGLQSRSQMCDPPPLYADSGLWFETIIACIMIPNI